MWIDTPRWVAGTSFPDPVAIPADLPTVAPYVYIFFNATWLPVVLGALSQLSRPQTWIAASQTQLDSVLGEVQDLLAQIAATNGPQPPIFQVTNAGLLQVSTDGGTTWVTVLPFHAYPPGDITVPVPVLSGAMGNGGPSPLILNGPGGVFVRNGA